MTPPRLLGESAAIRLVREQIRTVGPLDVPVLIEGESGTGKGLVARAIHEASPRREGRFRAISVIGLEEPLAMSRLFGHRGRAFPGADSDQSGVFEGTHGGTVLLDELADLPAGVQERLLRALETGQITRLGDPVPRTVGVRVLIGTSRSPEKGVTAGWLRQDLFDRLRTMRIGLPPLRSRPEDIPLLAVEFLRRAVAECGKRVDEISREAMDCLTRHRWPGNVRELEAAIQCAVIWATGSTVRSADLPPELRPRR